MAKVEFWAYSENEQEPLSLERVKARLSGTAMVQMRETAGGLLTMSDLDDDEVHVMHRVLMHDILKYTNLGDRKKERIASLEHDRDFSTELTFRRSRMGVPAAFDDIATDTQGVISPGILTALADIADPANVDRNLEQLRGAAALLGEYGETVDIKAIGERSARQRECAEALGSLVSEEVLPKIIAVHDVTPDMIESCYAGSLELVPALEA